MRIEISSSSTATRMVWCFSASSHDIRPVETIDEFYLTTSNIDLDRITETGLSADFINERLEACWST